ncbi:MAG: PfkB family carbohydrate kinase [Elusimicrobiota bacterium]
MKPSRPSLKRLLSILARFRRRRVLVLGDLMLDHFVRGRVNRLSPEAPVPVVAVDEETHMPGGAGNVCSNLSALGAAVSVFGVLGDDAAGGQLIRDLQARGVDTGGVVLDALRVTTQKCRIVAEHQQVVRFDRETPRVLSAQTQSKLLRKLSEAMSGADAVVVSDYGKGVVTANAVRKALRAAHRARLPVVVDPKVEHFRRYKGVDCITPNLQEAWGGMGLHPSQDEAAIHRLGRRILAALRVRSVLITRAEKGMTLFAANDPGPILPSRTRGAEALDTRAPRARARGAGKIVVDHIPTQAKEVYDVTGAGDTVVSVLSLALASGARLYEAAVLANLAASIVVGKLGTATISADEIKRAVRESGRRRS